MATLHGELTLPDIQNIFVQVFFGLPGDEATLNAFKNS